MLWPDMPHRISWSISAKVLAYPWPTVGLDTPLIIRLTPEKVSRPPFGPASSAETDITILLIVSAVIPFDIVREDQMLLCHCCVLCSNPEPETRTGVVMVIAPSTVSTEVAIPRAASAVTIFAESPLMAHIFDWPCAASTPLFGVFIIKWLKINNEQRHYNHILCLSNVSCIDYLWAGFYF